MHDLTFTPINPPVNEECFCRMGIQQWRMNYYSELFDRPEEILLCDQCYEARKEAYHYDDPIKFAEFCKKLRIAVEKIKEERAKNAAFNARMGKSSDGGTFIEFGKHADLVKKKGRK